MNNKVKKWLIITIALQIILLVLPAGIKATNQHIIEKNAPVKGKEFRFQLSNVWWEDDRIDVSFSLDNAMDYYSSNQKIQVCVDENGQTTGYNYKGENDWYIYGRYYSEFIPLESLQFCNGYDSEKLHILFSEESYMAGWGSLTWYTEHFKAELAAIVYKGLIIPKAIYIDGVKVADII